jgi:hypothetical protein
MKMNLNRKGGEDREKRKTPSGVSGWSGRPGLGFGRIAITAGPVMANIMKGRTKHG